MKDIILTILGVSLYMDELHKACITKYLDTAHQFAQCNMFICRKEVIDDYCSWLFYWR